MFAIQAANRSRQWISGVFDSRAAADEYLTRIPKGQRSNQVVIDLGGMTYPLYLCEDDKGFRFMTEDEAVAQLKRIVAAARRDDEDWCYMNLYQFVGDWQPRLPGTDYMGILPHHHVTNFTLEWVQREGFHALWD